MGVGRRMKKQGMPEPLPESHFANLKRKKGLPVDDPSTESSSTKKRKTNKKQQVLKSQGKANSAKGTTSKPIPRQANGAKASSVTPRKAGKKSKAKPLPEEDEDEDDELESLSGADDDDVD